MDSYMESQIISSFKCQDIKTIINLLHSRKLDPNYRYSDLGVASMHLAVGYGSEAVGAQIMYQLLKHGGDPNLPSQDGTTPVHVASSWCRTTILQLLLLYGGNPWIQDDDMRNAFTYAEEAKAWPALEMLHNFQLNKATVNRSKKLLEVSPVKTINILPENEGDISRMKFLLSSETKVGVDKSFGTSRPRNRRTYTVSETAFNDIQESYRPLNLTYEIGQTAGSLQNLHLETEEASDDLNGIFPIVSQKQETENILEDACPNDRIPSQDFGKSSDDILSPNCDLIHLEESQFQTCVEQTEANSTFSLDPHNNDTEAAILCNPLQAPEGDFNSDIFQNSASSSRESNFLNVALIESGTSNDVSNTSHSYFSTSIEISLDDNTATGKDVRKTYTIQTGKTDLIKATEKTFVSPKKTVLAMNACVEKVKLFEEKLKKASKKTQITRSNSNELNKTFSKKQSPESRAMLFAELSEAVSRRSLKISGVNSLSTDLQEGFKITSHAVKSIENCQPQVKGVASPTTDIAITDLKKTDAQVQSHLGIETKNKTEVEVLSATIENKPSVVQSPGSSVEELYISCEGDTSIESVSREGDEELRSKLLECGKDIGPVTDTTRAVYRRMLEHIKSTGTHSTPELSHQKVAQNGTSQIIPQSAASRLDDVPQIYNFNYQYCPELMSALQSNDRSLPYENLELNIQKDFNESWQDWRGGSSKTCFNYLLLDERVTRNLPARSATLSFQEVTRIFIEATFYVGKGQASRPYAHLQSASTVWRAKSVPADPKTAHILSIWKAGCGVVCLHIFHNTIAAEAHTREAAMIDGLGRTNVRNLRRGEYYGRAARWPLSDKRRLGVRLLLKARDILLSEGERVIRPEDMSQNLDKTKFGKRHKPSQVKLFL